MRSRRIRETDEGLIIQRELLELGQSIILLGCYEALGNDGLELHRICTSVCSEPDELLSEIDVALMIVPNLCDEENTLLDVVLTDHHRAGTSDGAT